MNLFTESDSDFLIERYDAVLDPAAFDGVLFAEDFTLNGEPAAVDAAPAVSAAEPAPTLTEADVQSARMLGYQDGVQAGLHEACGRTRLAEEAACGALDRALAAATTAAQETVRETADTLTRTILRTLAALLPELCATHGAAEAASLLRALLPMLAQQPRLTLRANPLTMKVLQRAAAAHDNDTATRISFIATDAVAEGDVTLQWQDGAATRDTTAVLQQLRMALAPLGVGAQRDPLRDTKPPPQPARQPAPELHTSQKMELAHAD